MIIKDPNTGITVAIVLRKYDTDELQPEDTTTFLTEPTASLQLAVHNRPTGHVVDLHSHRQCSRYVQHTMETLFIQNGGPVVGDLYYLTNEKHPVPKFLEQVKLYEGDVIHLMYGAHSFRWDGNARVVESKQGPYVSRDKDKEIY